MKKKKAKGKKGRVFLIIVCVLAAVIAITVFVTAIDNSLTKNNTESLRDSILHAAFQCYSVEGVYPDNFAYLETAYGVMVDHKRFIVEYECFASNRPPKVKVLAK